MKNSEPTPTQEEAIREIDRRSTEEALRLKEQLGNPGVFSILIRMILHSKAAFFRLYFGQLKFLDGFDGIRLSVNASIETFAGYAKLYELLYSSDEEKKKVEQEFNDQQDTD